MTATRTQVIATLGPASRSPETLRAMAAAGMRMARINFSHGTIEEHQRLLRAVRELRDPQGRPVAVLQDLEGYRIRVGPLEEPVLLQSGEEVWMSSEAHRGLGHIPLDADIDLRALKKGMEVYIDDGLIALTVLGHRAGRVRLRVTAGGLLKSRKGVNIPRLELAADILTEKDRCDIAFGVAHGVDVIAQSFVRNRRDIEHVLRLVRPHRPRCRVLAKIENAEGVAHLEEILEACDGLIVARGDLGVSLPIYQVPCLQKRIIRACNLRKKAVVTATQMLESMTHSPRPTRAEVSDVANAIWDGTDYVMLSGETAVGRFPVEAVSMMRQIIVYSEQHADEVCRRADPSTRSRTRKKG